MNETINIRPATEADTPLILRFIRALAEYEGLADRVSADEATLRRSLFGPDRSAECLLAYEGGEPVGFAIFFHNFSTFLGRPGIYLEDLFVEPGGRGKGIGKGLLEYLARLATRRDCGRLEWAVLDWNEPSINFYKSLNAEPQDEWTVYRLEGEALEALAKQPD